MNRKQLTVFFAMLATYALCAFVAYVFLMDQMTSSINTPVPTTTIPPVLLGLANAGIVLVAYGLAGLAGIWFARKLGLPGVFSEDGNWRGWLWVPMGLGVLSGLMLIAGDVLFAGVNGLGRFPHPPFPTSIVASLSAGIGEEILFRGLVFGLWAFVLNWLFKRFQGRSLALWIANVIGALAFGAAHFAPILYMTGGTSMADINPMLMLEIFLLNGVIGLIAGWRYMKDGLVAASTVHFTADVVFHVLWGLFS